jgi:hypothetical protein
MRNTVSTNGRGSPAVFDHPHYAQTDPALELEELPPGQRFSARDGCRFIRTNLICFGFCDLATGQLCSARDIYAKHGGVCAARKRCHKADGQTDKDPKAAPARHE